MSLVNFAELCLIDDKVDKELDQELREILKTKDEAVRSQDFEKAGQLREREMEIKAQINAIAQSKKGGEKENPGRQRTPCS